MAKMIQIRHVPDQVHRKLKARAATEGLSLSDYLKREVQRLAEQPTLREMLERLAARGPINVATPPEDIIRAERDSR